MTSTEIVQRAKEQLAQLIGLTPDTVSRLSRDGEGWHVTVEMIEAKRIPDIYDIMATYESLFDNEGNLVRYHCTKRYVRKDME